jgi:N-acyl-D-aspartate/D-glutamate deacylase
LLEISIMAVFATVIRHGTIATASETYPADIGIRDGRIVAIGEKLADADEVIDATASIGDRCGFVPSIKFEDAASRNTP